MGKGALKLDRPGFGFNGLHTLTQMHSLGISLLFYLIFWFEGHTWQYSGFTYGSFLAEFRGPYKVPRTELKSDIYKTSVQPTTLSFQPLDFFFLFSGDGDPHSVFSGQCGMLGIEPGLAICKANALLAVLLFWPLIISS